MRVRRGTVLPIALASMLAALIVPVAALAASGLPATIAMNPAEAGPGSTVEVVGLDFPGSSSVELQLTTTAGPVHLGSATTEEGGYFRHALALPSDIAPGFWELRATAPNGAVAVHIFEAGGGMAAAAQVTSTEATAAAGGGAGMATADMLVIIVLLLLVGGVGGAAAFVWRQTHRPTVQPGMGAGDDPIWGGAHGDS